MTPTTLLSAALILGAFTSAPVAAEPIDIPRLLRCIAEVEGGKADALGGVCCISETAWKDRTNGSPYGWSRYRGLCKSACERQIEWIRDGLTAAHLTPTPESIAECWRHGLHHYLTTHTVTDYARRVGNLYREGTK